MPHPRTIILAALAILAIGLAACASAPEPQGVVDVGNPPDTSTITPQKASLAGLDIECAAGYDLTINAMDATCIGDKYSWSAVAYEEANDGAALEAVAKQKVLEEYPNASPDQIVTGLLNEAWAFARLDLAETFTVYVSATARVELSVSRADAADRTDISVAPSPERRPLDSRRSIAEPSRETPDGSVRTPARLP